MAVPRSRISNARKNARRAHHAKQPKHFQACSNCHALKLPHVVCPFCGYYKGRMMIQTSGSDE